MRLSRPAVQALKYVKTKFDLTRYRQRIADLALASIDGATDRSTAE